ncbi:hypothetical protein WAI453_006921 [Rhynchosporium graminicola]|uniref:Uncharacterized protein n=1 Tax=Rhynchosporium graminicola TaxID=2792576 RepID=A0A1E1KTP5_9HELO|nr:uncharacterized protein RCO7_02076 [Rhynchosporium commune]
MVILGGLELVAVGYVIHKHAQNKKEKQRIAEEAAALEEQQYRVFPSDRRGRHAHSQHRRRRSHSRRRHSADGRFKKESPRPLMPDSRPPQYNAAPVPMQKPFQRPSTYPQPFQSPNAPLQPPQQRPQPQMQAQLQPQHRHQSQPQAQYPPDIKYGWIDEPARPALQQDPYFPPTGWPAHWEQSRTAGPQIPESSRGRQERRPESPHVRFAPPRHTASVRSSSRSPPPSYRA